MPGEKGWWWQFRNMAPKNTKEWEDIRKKRSECRMAIPFVANMKHNISVSLTLEFKNKTNNQTKTLWIFLLKHRIVIDTFSFEDVIWVKERGLKVQEAQLQWMAVHLQWMMWNKTSYIHGTTINTPCKSCPLVLTSMASSSQTYFTYGTSYFSRHCLCSSEADFLQCF